MPKLIIDIAHREFFQNNGYIQFEGLISEEQIERVQLEINAILAKRGDPGDLFHSGHDLWRSSEQFNKILKQRDLARVASELLLRKPLRLGYDQYLVPPLTYPCTDSLNRISSIQGILCGLLICLVNAETVIPNDIFPTKAGDGTYFLADFDFPWEQMAALTDLSYLLVVYTHERALYIHQINDPHQHVLKEYGYTYGDRLTDQWNPIVYQ